MYSEVKFDPSYVTRMTPFSCQVVFYVTVAGKESVFLFCPQILSPISLPQEQVLVSQVNNPGTFFC